MPDLEKFTLEGYDGGDVHIWCPTNKHLASVENVAEAVKWANEHSCE